MPDQTASLTDFLRNFAYLKGPLFEGWFRIDRTEGLRGDCGAFAWTTLCLLEGGTVPALKAVWDGRAGFYRARSKVNGIVPRHVVLYVEGVKQDDDTFPAWIDSTYPKWAATTKHDVKWRIRLPWVLVYVAWATLPGKLLIGGGGVFGLLNAWRLW